MSAIAKLYILADYEDSIDLYRKVFWSLFKRKSEILQEKCKYYFFLAFETTLFGLNSFSIPV